MDAPCGSVFDRQPRGQQVINTYYENFKATQAEYVQKFLLGQLELNDTNWAKFEADLIANG